MKAKCLCCGMVADMIPAMVEHTKDTGHQWYRIGEENVFKVVLYVDNMEAKDREIKAENRGYENGWEEARDEGERSDGIIN